MTQPYVSATDYFSDEPAWADRAAEARRLAAVVRSLTRSRRPAGSHVRGAAEPKPTTTRPQPFRVEVSRFVAEMIERADLADGSESGGPLLAVGTSDGVRLVDAAGHGSDAERSPGHIRLDLDRFRYFEQTVARAGFEGRLAGDWHVHCRRGALEPSEADRDAWAGNLELTGASSWVGLIRADDPSGPSSPRWAAYVTTVGARGQVCKPAELVFEKRSWE